MASHVVTDVRDMGRSEASVAGGGDDAARHVAHLPLELRVEDPAARRDVPPPVVEVGARVGGGVEAVPQVEPLRPVVGAGAVAGPVDVLPAPEPAPHRDAERLALGAQVTRDAVG